MAKSLSMTTPPWRYRLHLSFYWSDCWRERNPWQEKGGPPLAYFAYRKHASRLPNIKIYLGPIAAFVAVYIPVIATK